VGRDSRIGHRYTVVVVPEVLARQIEAQPDPANDTRRMPCRHGDGARFPLAGIPLPKRFSEANKASHRTGDQPFFRVRATGSPVGGLLTLA